MSELATSLAASLAIALIAASIGTLLGFVTARRLGRLGVVLALLPFAFAPVVYAAASLFVYTRLLLAGTFGGVALAHTCVAYALAAVLSRSIWTPQLYAMADTARTLGATPWQALVRVLLPASLPQLRVVAAQTFLVSWMQYGLTLVLGGGHVRTLPLVVFSAIAEASLGRAALASLLLVVPAWLVIAWPQPRRA